MRIHAVAEDADLAGGFPRIVESVGEAPSQYPDWEEEDWEEEDEREVQ